MRAEIRKITPELAKELLKMNIENRDLKAIKNSYVKQMIEGRWKENGEPIIIDKNGIIKDGQHRLTAVIEAGYSYLCPIIYDVNPDVMDTIDTGTNRTLPDILKLNGFAYNCQMSALIKGIFKYTSKHKTLKSSSESRVLVTNSAGLDYAKKNKDDLIKIIRTAGRIKDRESINILSPSEIAIYIYILSKGLKIQENVEMFLDGVCGNIADSNSAHHYVFKKLLAAKESNINMKSLYKTNIIIKCFNIFNNSDMPITKLHVKSDRYEEVIINN